MIRNALLSVLVAPMLACALPTIAHADMASEVKSVNDNWAHITYEIKGSSTQTKALDQLARQAATLVAHYPGKAEPLLWQGIVTSEQANRANIFHKLSLATRARDLIAKAYSIDPDAGRRGAEPGRSLLQGARRPHRLG